MIKSHHVQFSGGIILIGFNERFDLMYSNIDLIKGSFKDTFKNEYKLKIIDNVKSINKFK